MRISDWSSDVCSSDLGVSAHDIGPKRGMADIDRDIGADPLLLDHRKIFGEGLEIPLNSFFQRLDGHPLDTREVPHHQLAIFGLARRDGERSEEHTSELQSLMRISYAVFCLKKKIQSRPLTC